MNAAYIVLPFLYLCIAGLVLAQLSLAFRHWPYANFKTFLLALCWPITLWVIFIIKFIEWITKR